MKRLQTCEILTCGTEILMGQTLNTNANYLSKRLADVGLSSYYQTTVGDNEVRLKEAIDVALSRSDCVIMTGGLGPTEDDISMAVSSAQANQPLVVSNLALKSIHDYFDAIGKIPAKNNFKQANVALFSKVMINQNGTAPGVIIPVFKEDYLQHTLMPLVESWCKSKQCSFSSMVLQTDGYDTFQIKEKEAYVNGWIILLPGPPLENQLMFETQVVPFLQSRQEQTFHTKHIHMIGIGESDACHILNDLIVNQTNPTLAPYCSEGQVMFRLTETTPVGKQPKYLDQTVQQIKQLLGKYIYEIGDRSLSLVTVDLLREQKKTLSIAESCTGGLVMSMFCEIPGVSDVLAGGFVTYSNNLKISILDVPKDHIETFGVVSVEVATDMAVGCKNKSESDIAVSITGIAGPTGATETKPVGTVCFAITDGMITKTSIQHFRGNRQKIRKLASIYAINLVRTYLLKTLN